MLYNIMSYCYPCGFTTVYIIGCKIYRLKPINIYVNNTNIKNIMI